MMIRNKSRLNSLNLYYSWFILVVARMNTDVKIMRYIGSKRSLLENIDNVLSKHIDGTEQTFLDLFAGTNVVGRHFKSRYTIISNDILYFSFVN